MINVNLADFPAVQTAGNIFLATVLVGWGPLVWWITRSARRSDPADVGD
ncbi:MAG: hypothetical protein IH587_03275 [Anaerolineae bacterium]|nr:hypothetical protein [Anaerolineae bacterium]